MTRIFYIAHTVMRLFMKKTSAYVWLFVKPLPFVYFMSFINCGANDPANRRPSVLIENADTNFLGRLFLDELGAQGMRVVKASDRESAPRGIRIPADFTSNVLQQKQTKVQFFKRDSADETDAAIIQ